MTTLAKISIVALALSAGTAAHAMQEAAAPAPTVASTSADAIKAGAVVTTSDGRRLGRIERVENSADGQPATVKLIYDSRFVSIPTSTISAAGKGLVTSLTKAEVRKLK